MLLILEPHLPYLEGTSFGDIPLQKHPFYKPSFLTLLSAKAKTTSIATLVSLLATAFPTMATTAKAFRASPVC